MSELSRYGGRYFEAASALPLDGGLGRPRRLAALAAEMVRQPERFVALVRLLAATRSERIYLSDSPAGQALREYFDERFMGVFPQNRLCRGVLLLPSDHGEYLRGRRRQALRTNLRRAARAGIRCELTLQASRALDAARAVVDDRRAAVTDAEVAYLADTWPALFRPSQDDAARGPRPLARPQAVLAAVVDDAVCLIQLAMASSHDARWALHDHLVRLLIARRRDGTCWSRATDPSAPSASAPACVTTSACWATNYVT